MGTGHFPSDTCLLHVLHSEEVLSGIQGSSLIPYCNSFAMIFHFLWPSSNLWTHIHSESSAGKIKKRENLLNNEDLILLDELMNNINWAS
jgi:hypothetical protein